MSKSIRIIRGLYKNRLIKAPEIEALRPTTDRAKEGLFNIIESRFSIAQLRVLDLFAGSGNISFEFASRGAKEIIAVENSAKLTNFIQVTMRDLTISTMEVVRQDVFKYLESNTKKFDVIFADPPYASLDSGQIPNIVFEQDFLQKDGILIIEQGRKDAFKQFPQLLKEKSYGGCHFSIFSKTS